jgi:hypothetical protein
MKFLKENVKLSLNCIKKMLTKLNVINYFKYFFYIYIKELVSVKTLFTLIFCYYLSSYTWLMDYIIRFFPSLKHSPFSAIILCVLLIKFIFLIYSEISKYLNNKLEKNI